MDWRQQLINFLMQTPTWIQDHTVAPMWSESLAYSAAFALVAIATMLWLMQNGRWRSAWISTFTWTCAAVVVSTLTRALCAEISDLALPALGTLLFSLVYRLYLNRLTAFGLGLIAALMYVGCCVTLYVGELARFYINPEGSPVINSAIYTCQALGLAWVAFRLTVGLFEFPLGICLHAPKRDEAKRVMKELRDQYKPLVSIQVPCYSEPPELVIKTLNALAGLQYTNHEVLVIDNNTKDPALWTPVEVHCKKLGSQFRFFHVDPLSGAKAGAINYALKYSNPAAEVICVVDADYIVEPDFLDRYLPLFSDPKTGYVQLSHDYREWEESRFLTGAYHMYVNFHKTCLPNYCEFDAGYIVGTMCLLRRQALEEAGGWAEWCLTEDSELAVRIHSLGYNGHALADTAGRGLIPETFEGMKKQWFRWAAGPVQQFQRHWRAYIGLSASKMTFRQRANEIRHSFSHLQRVYRLFLSLLIVPIMVATIAGFAGKPLPWVSPGIFTLILLSVLASWIRNWVTFNHMNLCMPPHIRSFRGLKGLPTFATLKLLQNALHWTLIIATMTPIFKSRLRWLRTDKFDKAGSLLRALHASRTETAVAFAYFGVSLLLMRWAQFKPLDYTALVAIWVLWNGLGLLSPLCISLYSEWVLSAKETSAMNTALDAS